MRSIMAQLDRLQLMTYQLQLNTMKTKNAILMAKARIEKIRRRSTLKKSPRAKRSIWVRKWITRRPTLGHYARLMAELKTEDVKGFQNFLRVDPDMFKEILRRIEGRITKKDTHYRKALSPGLKLAITLRYLATGDSYHSLMFGFRVAHNTISLLIPAAAGLAVRALTRS
jgi:hypothetical protein